MDAVGMSGLAPISNDFGGGISDFLQGSFSSSGSMGGILGGSLGSMGGGFGSMTGSLGGVFGAVGSISSGIDFIEHVDEMDTGDAVGVGATTGLQIGSMFGPVGAVWGGVIGGIVGAVGSLFGSGDDPEHAERTAVRDWLRENTPLGEKLEFTGFVGGGELGTISLDGNSHKVDNSEGVLAQATGLTNVLAQALAGDNDRLKSEVSAMLLNAISGASNFEEALASIRSLMQTMGTNPEQLAQTMVGLFEQGAFSREQLVEHLDYINILAGNAPGPGEASGTEQIAVPASAAR